MAGKNNESTTKFKVDISNLKKGMQEAYRQIRLANAGFKAATAGMDDWSESADGISAKLKQLKVVLYEQKEQLSNLSRQHELVSKEQGENSKGAQELLVKINNQKAAIERTNKEIKNWTNSLENIKNESNKTKTETELLSSSIDVQQKELEALKTEYTDIILKQGKHSKEAKKLAKEIYSLSDELNKNKNTLQDAERVADEFDNTLDDVKESAEKANEGFTVMKGVVADLASTAIKKLTSSLKNLVSNAIEVGTNFSSSMSEVQAISGATGEDLEKLEKTAREYGATTVFSASESADALKYMALAGWDAEQSSSALGGVLNLAAASGMDLAASSDMCTDYLSAFSMKAKDSAYFADLLAYAQGNSNTSAEQLGEAYKNCAANLNAAGQDVETTTSLLAAMANQGLKGSESGTALTAMMRDLTSKMTEVKDKAKLAELAEEGYTSATGNLNDMLKQNVISVGKTLIAVSDAKGNYRDMTDILKDVEKATKGMGSAEKAAALSSTFTSDSIKGLNLVLNEGVDKTAKFEKKLRKADGTAQEMADTMNDNLEGDMKQFQSAMEEVSIKIYKVLEPAMRDVVSWTTDIASDFSKWLENKENKKKIEELAKQLSDFVKGGLTDIKNFAEWFLDNKDAIISGSAGIVSGFVAFKSANTIISAVQAFQKLKTSLEGATAAQKLFNLASKANPAVIAAIAIGTLTTALVAHAKATKDSKNEVALLTKEEKKNKNSVEELAKSYNEIKDTKEKSVADTQAEFGYYSELKEELDSIVKKNGKIKKGYEDRASFIVNELNEAIGTELSISDNVIENYKEEKETIDKLLKTKKAQIILNANEEAYTEAIKNKTKAFSNLSTAQNNYTKTSQELADAQKYLAECESKLGSETQTYMYENYDRFVEAEKVVEELTQKQEKQEKTLKKAQKTYTEYNTVIENYEGLSSAIISEDAEKINSSLQNMINNFVTAENGTKESLEKQVKNMKKNYEDLQKAVEAGTPGVTKEMVKSAKEMVEKAETELAKLEPKAKEAGEKAGKANADGMKSKAKEVEKAAEEVAKKADTGLKKTKAKDSGVNFVQGFVDGINKKANDGTLSGAVAALASKTVEWLNINLDIHSPSKLTYKSGVYFTEGFTNGVLSGITKAKEAVVKLAKETVKSTVTKSVGETLADKVIEGINKQKKNVKKSAEELGELYVSTAKTKAETLAKNNKLNLAQEVSYWKEIVKATKKGTSAREKAEKQLTKAKKNYASEQKKIDEEYLESVKKVNTELKNNIQSVIDAYDEQVKSRKESIVSELSLFDAFESATEYSSEKLIENLKSQVKAVEEWDAVLDNLQNRDIVPNDFIEELQEMGINSLANIKLLDSMDNEDLEEYIKLWKQKNQLAQERAEQENEELKKATQKQIEELVEAANKELTALEKEYNKSLKAIGKNATDQSKTIGKNIVAGLKKGIESETSSFQKYLKNFFSSITSTAKNALKIHSPSKIMSDEVGKYVSLGLAEGITKNKDAITEAMQTIKNDLAKPINIDTNLAKQRIASGVSDGVYGNSGNVAKTTNYYEFKQYNSSPKALSRLEIYRQTKNQLNFAKGV